MKTGILHLMVALLLVPAAAGEVVIDSVSIDPTHIEAGDTVDIYVKFHEGIVKRDIWSGAGDASEGKTLIRDDSSVFYTTEIAAASDAARKYVTLIDTEKKVGHLFPGESWTTPFKVKIAGDAPEAEYSLEFRVYKTDATYKSMDIARTLNFEVPVGGVVKFKLDSKNSFNVGETNKMEVSIENMGGGRARHTTVSVNASKPLMVLDSSEKYVGSVEGGERKDLLFSVYAESDAKLGPYEVPTTVEYLNDEGARVVVSKIVGVRVDGKPEVSVGLDSQGDFKPEGSGKVVLNVVNNGFVDVKFLRLRLLPSDNYRVTSVDEAYIGNLDSDDYETEEFSVKLAENVKEGVVPLKAEAEYKTENNEVTQKVQYTVNLNVLSESEYNLKHPEEAGKSKVTSILLAVPAVIAGYLVLWFIYKLVGEATGFINSKLFARRKRQ